MPRTAASGCKTKRVEIVRSLGLLICFSGLGIDTTSSRDRAHRFPLVSCSDACVIALLCFIDFFRCGGTATVVGNNLVRRWLRALKLNMRAHQAVKKFIRMVPEFSNDGPKTDIMNLEPASEARPLFCTQSLWRVADCEVCFRAIRTATLKAIWNSLSYKARS